MSATTQGERASALIAATQALNARAAIMEESLDAPALAWHPPAGGWSVGQVFEHLCVANDDYLAILRDRFSVTPPFSPGSRTAIRWKPSLAGRFLVASFESSRKLPAPKMWRPTLAPRPNVISEFVGRQRELVQLIERSMSFDWMRVRMGSPVSPLIRMNAGDAFTILVTHAERHFRQIDRIRTEYVPVVGSAEVEAGLGTRDRRRNEGWLSS